MGSMKASEFDRKFDNGENVLANLDISKARRPDEAIQSFSLDFPKWRVVSLDREARRLGVSRQSIIKMWLAERLRRSG